MRIGPSASSLSGLARALEMPVSSQTGHHPLRTAQESARPPNTYQSRPRHPVAGQQTLRECCQPLGRAGNRPAEWTFPSAQIATTHKSRCTSRPIAWPTHLVNATAHVHTIVVDTTWENRRGNDTDRYEFNRSIQASRRGGRKKKAGSKPIAENGLRRLRSPKEGPCPGSADAMSEPWRPRSGVASA
jgi:hypothetical protein